MNGMMKQVSLWLVLLIIVVLAVTRFNGSSEPDEVLGEIDFVPLLGLSEDGPASEAPPVELEGPVTITTAGNQYNIKATFKEPLEGGQESIEFKTTEGDVERYKQLMVASGVKFEQKTENTVLTSLLINILPLILIIGVFWFFMFRQMQGGSNKAMSFGKSRAKLANQSDKTATFSDVAGIDEAKEELQEIIEFLRDPKKFTRLGGKIPRGVLLVGPPGSGKTLLARAVAGEAEVPFFSISGSDFVEMFVGVGASRVRDLFQQGHKHAPCIIFIDEIDAVGRQRGAGLGGGHDEREQTLNQLLVEMDGFETNDGVILMAATNRPDVLDRALLRPGRFDRQIMVSNPDIRGREAILEIHLRNQKVPLAEDVECKVLARGTPGFSGADLANMVNEAALLAARRVQDLVTMIDFEDAKDRVLMGPARRSMVLSEKEKMNTAVHEAGHALIGRMLPDGDPVHKATIIPRGPALGVTSFLPEEDRHGASKKYCLARIRMSMGGRAAEELVYNEYTSGCAGDLKHATHLAHSMVCEWGMSDLGPVAFGTQDEVFVGRDFSRQREFSDETAAAVDREVHRLLEEGYRDARQMLEEHQNILRALSDALYEKETLDAEEIDDIIRKHGGGHLLPEQPQQPKKPQSKPPSQKPERVADEDESDDGITDLPGDMVPGPA